VSPFSAHVAQQVCRGVKRLPVFLRESVASLDEFGRAHRNRSATAVRRYKAQNPPPEWRRTSASRGSVTTCSSKQRAASTAWAIQEPLLQLVDQFRRRRRNLELHDVLKPATNASCRRHPPDSHRSPCRSAPIAPELRHHRLDQRVGGTGLVLVAEILLRCSRTCRLRSSATSSASSTRPAGMPVIRPTSDPPAPA